MGPMNDTNLSDTQPAMTVQRLKDRSDYLRIAATGRRWVTKSFILQYRPAVDDTLEITPAANFPAAGFTVTKKVGNAVVRSRIKRRMKEAARVQVAAYGRPGAAYVMIGRRAALDIPFEQLLKDLRWALEKLGRDADLKGNNAFKAKSSTAQRHESNHRTKKDEKEA